MKLCKTLSLPLLLGIVAVASIAVAPVKVKLSKGTVIPVKLRSNLTSDRNHTGEVFMADVRSNYLGLPDGTEVEGVIAKAVPKSGKRPGTLSLKFTRILLPTGKKVAIVGSPIGLDSKSVAKRHDGTMVAKSGVTNQRLTYVGYGAAGGFLLSVLTGGPKAENTALGAALGYIAGSLVKGNKNKPNNVLLKSGTELGVRIDRQAVIQY